VSEAGWLIGLVELGTRMGGLGKMELVWLIIPIVGGTK
jgi:hypothetical protein